MWFHPVMQNLAVTSPDSSGYAVHKHSQTQNIILFQVYTYISGSGYVLEAPDATSLHHCHLDITFRLQLVESSPLFPYFLEKHLTIPDDDDLHAH